MTRRNDPVDDALGLLRNEEWSGSTTNRQLENKLMSEFDANRSGGGLAKRRVFAFAAVFVAVAGATFAAGGVEKIRQWFITIEVNGDATDIELDENGEASFTVDTQDGGIAVVHVAKQESPDGGEMTELTVQATVGDGKEVDVVKETCCKKVIGSRPSEGAYSLDDLGDAEAYSEWDGADGTVNQLYVLPGIEGTGSRVFLVNGTNDEDATVNLVANTPMDLLADDVETDIGLDW